MHQRIGPVLLLVTMEMEPQWEDEVNEWYDTEHLAEIMAVPGVISARRFVKIHGPEVTAPTKHLCVYQIANEEVVSGEPYLTFHSGWMGKPGLHSAWTDRVASHFRTHRSVRHQVWPIRGVFDDRSGPGAKATMPVVGSSLEDAWKEPIGGAILHELMTPDPDREEAILAWYDEVQTPRLMACPGFLGARRFMLRYDPPRGDASVVGHHKYLCLFQIANEDAFRTEAFRTAHAELSESLKELGGSWSTNRAAYRQTFPAEGAFEDHSGPKPRA